MALPHLGLHVLKPNPQQEALKVGVVAVLGQHDMTLAPRVSAHTSAWLTNQRLRATNIFLRATTVSLGPAAKTWKMDFLTNSVCSCRILLAKDAIVYLQKATRQPYSLSRWVGV